MKMTLIERLCFALCRPTVAIFLEGDDGAIIRVRAGCCHIEARAPFPAGVDVECPYFWNDAGHDGLLGAAESGCVVAATLTSRAAIVVGPRGSLPPSSGRTTTAIVDDDRMMEWLKAAARRSAKVRIINRVYDPSGDSSSWSGHSRLISISGGLSGTTAGPVLLPPPVTSPESGRS